MADFTTEVLTWDSKYFRTIRDLTTKPAQVSKDYVGGKRRRYVNPLKYCLTVAALFFLLNTVLGVDLTKTELGLEVDNTPSTSEELTSDRESNAPDRLELGRQFISAHMNLMVFLSVPLKALALWFLFRRSGRNLAEVFVLTLYLTGQVYLLVIPLSILGAILGVVLSRVIPLLDYCLFTWASVAYFDSSLFTAAWKNIVATMFRILGVGIPVGAILLVYVVFFP